MGSRVIEFHAQTTLDTQLGPLFGEGSPTTIDYRKKGALILSSLLEDLDNLQCVMCDSLCSLQTDRHTHKPNQNTSYDAIP